MKTSGDTNVKVAARCRPFNGELRYMYSNFIFRFIGLPVVGHINLSATVRLIINIPNMSTVHLDTYFKYKRNCSLLQSIRLYISYLYIIKSC